MKFEDLPVKTQLMLYVQLTSDSQPKAIFCTCDPKLHAAGDELIAEGKLIESEGPGGADRAFVFPKK